MRAKKTFTSRLTNKYLLIIRNEENFAEKTTFSFNYARLIALGTAIFLVILVLCLYLAKTVLSVWFDPQYAQMENSRKLYNLQLTIDTLEREVALKNQFINEFTGIVKGEDTIDSLAADTSEVDGGALLPQRELEASRNQPAVEVSDDGQVVDSLFRSEFEQSFLTGITTGSSYSGTELSEIYFFSPLSGVVTNSYDPKADHYGVDIVAANNEPVRCVADGTVVFADYDFSDSGYVIGIQHRNNLISIYKHNSALFKKVGNFVSAGDVVAVVGDTGELTTGPHLHFELWYNGNPINPQAFVSF